MDARQVFFNYEPVELGGLQRIKFCPGCGAPFESEPNSGWQRCSHCGFVIRSRTSTGVATLVADGSRFVLTRRGPLSFGAGAWCLPQGGIEYGEDFLTAALREVKEETNLDVELISLLSVTSNFLRPGSHSLVAVLLAHPLGGELKAGDDADAVAWFTWGDSLPGLTFVGDRHIIDRYFSSPFPGAPIDPHYARSHLPGPTPNSSAPNT
jgi:8-oxo-dGTP diphosphatase